MASRWLAMGLWVLGGCAHMSAGGGHWACPDAPAAAPAGSVYVCSDRPAARVLADGKDQGPAPVLLRNLPNRLVELEARLDGEIVRQQVLIDPEHPQVVRMHFEVPRQVDEREAKLALVHLEERVQACVPVEPPVLGVHLTLDGDKGRIVDAELAKVVTRSCSGEMVRVAGNPPRFECQGGQVTVDERPIEGHAQVEQCIRQAVVGQHSPRFEGGPQRVHHPFTRRVSWTQAERERLGLE